MFKNLSYEVPNSRAVTSLMQYPSHDIDYLFINSPQAIKGNYLKCYTCNNI